MCNVKISKDQIQTFLKKQLEGKTHQGIAFIMVGGPGSGKNSVKDFSVASLGLDEKTFAIVDFDIVLETFYDNKISCRESAYDINKYVLDNVLERHIDFVYCGTGKNPESYIPDVIQRTKKNNYKVYLSIIANTTDTAIPRVIKRTLNTGRDFNIDAVKNIYSNLEKDILTYMSLDCSDVDGIFVIDNSSKKPQFLYTSMCNNDIKSVKCYDVAHNYAYVTEFCPSLWKEVCTMLYNGIIIAALIGIAAYYIILYKSHWSIILIISAIIPYCTAKYQIHLKTIKETVFISLLTAAVVFFDLLQRYHASESVIISILSGIITGISWHTTM